MYECLLGYRHLLEWTWYFIWSVSQLLLGYDRSLLIPREQVQCLGNELHWVLYMLSPMYHLSYNPSPITFVLYTPMGKYKFQSFIANTALFEIRWSAQALRGNCTPNQNWACFVSYLKILNTFLENNVYIQKQLVWET